MATSDLKTGRQPWEGLDDDLDDSNVTAVPLEEAQKIDDALGLQMISIRLQRSLLDNLKIIAKHHGIGYQPLIRDLLNRFARSELQCILHELVKTQQAKIEQLQNETSSQAPLGPIDEFLAREGGERKRA
jgi:predicted DNA binding CopG/RHH family protein